MSDETWRHLDLDKARNDPLIRAISELAELKQRAFRVSMEEIMVTSSGRRTYNISYIRKSDQQAVSFQVEANNPDTAVGLAVVQASRNEGGFVDNLRFDDTTAQGLFKSLCDSVAIGRSEGHIDFIYPERH